MDVNVFFGVVFSFHGEGLSVTYLDRHLVEAWRTEYEHTVRRVHLIEAHGRKDIPCRHLTTVFVADNSVRSVLVELIHDVANLFSSLPLLARIGIHIGNVVARFVAVSILANQTGNVCRCFFTHAVVVYEELVKSFQERLVTTEQVDQSIDILWYEESVLPTVSFAEI